MASSLCEIYHTDGKLIPLQIIAKTHSRQDDLVANVTTNIGRDIIRFMDLPGLLCARNQPLAVVGGGPSLNQYIDKIKTFEHVLVCGSAHDHLIGLGVTPTFAIAVDSKEDAVEYFQRPQERTSYLLASQCHPNIFERLKDHKVALWNFRGQLEDESAFGGEPAIAWGCMVGVISLQIALYLGFQELHFFGFDCSYVGDDHHSYDVGTDNAGIQDGRTWFNVNGRRFYSTTALVAQAEHFFDVFASEDGEYLKGYVYGDGLLPNIIKASPPEMKEWLEAA